MPASPALGWPSADQTDRLFRFAPVAGHNQLLVSPSSGLAARADVLRFPAWAPQADEQEAMYLSLASHVVFERRHETKGEAKASEVEFHGPAARHLAVQPTRLRAPLANVVAGVLERLAPRGESDEGGVDIVAPISPPHVERASIGLRPGEFHAWTASIVLPAETQGFDPEHASYGRPASSAPVLARQLRMPRAPLFPDDQLLTLLRRTFMSGADKLLDGRLAQMLVFPGHATVVGFLGGEQEDRYAMQSVAENPGLPFRLEAGWNGTLQLAISSADALDADQQQRMASLGLAPHKDAGFSAALRIGQVMFPFDEWRVAHRKDLPSVLSLSMKAPKAAEAVALARNAAVDVPLVLEFQAVAKKGAAPEPSGPLGLRAGVALREGPSVNLTLPLLRSAAGLNKLPVQMRTLAFGDPDYDRQLGSPVFPLSRTKC